MKRPNVLVIPCLSRALAGFATLGGSWGVGAGHVQSWKGDTGRYAAAPGYAALGLSTANLLRGGRMGCHAPPDGARVRRRGARRQRLRLDPQGVGGRGRWGRVPHLIAKMFRLRAEADLTWSFGGEFAFYIVVGRPWF